MNRIDRLTSVRGFAALYVLLFHCKNTLPWFTLGRLNGFASKGYLAVDFFFVLSGFILSHVYLRGFEAHRHRQGRFLALRLGRIYPAHLATLVLAILITRLPGFEQHRWLTYDLPSLLTNLLLVHSWGFHGQLSWNYVSWSISAEWFAYLLFPVFAWASGVARGRARSACVLAAGTLLLLALVIGLLNLAGTAPPADAAELLRRQPQSPFSVAANFGVVRVAFEFFVGVLLYRAYESWHDLAPRLTGPAVVVTALLLAATLCLNWGHAALVQDATAVLLIGALILLLAIDRSGVSRPLDHPALVYIGEISYSLYMVHGIGFLLYFAALDAGWIVRPASAGQAYAWATALLLFSAASGMLSYHWLETPLRDRLKRWLDRRSAAAVKPAQVAPQP